MSGIINTRKSRRLFTDEQLCQAIRDSRSQADVLKRLGLNVSGANYTQLKHYIAENNLDTSHFTGEGWARDKKQIGAYLRKIPLEDVFSGKYVMKSSNHLKRRLIEEGFFEHKCYCCNSREWYGQPIPLELEHKNGNHFDNSLENLTLLCPNCHALTPTHSGKNKGKMQEIR